MSYQNKYDVIVIGGGHAGTEAALAAARMGMATLLLTHNFDTLGQMSCNPAIGGIGKGHLVKEIDALGGVMAWAADRAGIHFRTLNASKGPAVRATRAQADRVLYRNAVRSVLENQENLSLFQQGVDDLIIENNQVTGVKTQMGLEFFASSVILTVGTFLGGRIHVGLTNTEGGRAGDPPANALALRLRELPFRVARLKTGTPPRLDGRSLDYSCMEEQPGDQPIPSFSYVHKNENHPAQTSCFITASCEQTHEIIRAGLSRSPMYSGVIEGTGPRYCPSIEDKVVRFSAKTSHQIFVEPEGLDSNEVYPNGISTSLPFDVQYEMVRSIRGFENAHITRPGYAIEYDYFDPRDLRSSLETRFIKNLYLAGQINGTTGYEEAAAQGLLAGINAALQVQGKEPWCPRRDEAYIGVLVDDLITRGTLEPYRMFTSRAEYRLQLREDNADLRLTAIGYKMGVISEQRYNLFSIKSKAIEAEQARLRATWVKPGTSLHRNVEETLHVNLSREYSLMDLLRRPTVTYKNLVVAIEEAGPAVADQRVAEQVEVQAKYSGYIERQQLEIDRQRRYENLALNDDFDYDSIKGLSSEVRQKLSAVKPATIGQASRISGVTPAAISLLLVYLKKYNGNMLKSA